MTNFKTFQSTILSSAFILINVTLAVSFTLLVRYLGHGEFVVPFCRALGKKKLYFFFVKSTLFFFFIPKSHCSLVNANAFDTLADNKKSEKE